VSERPWDSYQRDELPVDLFVARKWGEALEARLAAAETALREITALVGEQAEDEALWAIPPAGTQPIAEAYLQQELRRLHAAIEASLAVFADGSAAGQEPT
jgi:hypothetical protein